MFKQNPKAEQMFRAKLLKKYSKIVRNSQANDSESKATIISRFCILA